MENLKIAFSLSQKSLVKLHKKIVIQIFINKYIVVSTLHRYSLVPHSSMNKNIFVKVIERGIYTKLFTYDDTLLRVMR